ncbi:hypothetical protein ACQ4PT_036012 [Festuca glaucescens]
MEDLPEALVTEIVKKITSTSDLNSLSLVSKQLYKIEGNQRGAIRVGSGLCTATEALTSLCARFPNLWKAEFDYSGCIPGHGHQLDNKGLFVFSSHCSSLIDLTLNFCSYIDDSGLGCLAHCKTLVSLRLISTPQITSIGLFSVAVGCTSLSALHLIDCEKIESVEWLEYLGWTKLQKFEFEKKRGRFDLLPCDEVFDSTYDAHITDIYDFCCESLKDLSNLKSISLGLNLQRYSSDVSYCETRTSFTDNSLYALALNCRMLQILDLKLQDVLLTGHQK